MASKIKHKRSSVAGKVPLAADLEAGELALNTNDGKVFLKKDDDSILDITSTIFKNNTSVTVSDTGGNGEVIISSDGDAKITVSPTEIILDQNTTVENASEIQFKESNTNGQSYVGIAAPSSVPTSYSLKLPQINGTLGQTLSTDGLGNLQWSDPDVFGGNRIYVSESKGNDDNDGITAPVRTVKRALQLASGYVYSATNIYNEDVCSRDVGLIIDGLGYDLIYGSNWRSIKAGLMYYNSVASEVLTSQKPLTLNALNYLKTQVVNTQTFGSSEAITLGTLMDEIIDIFDNGLTAADAVSMPSPAGAVSGYTNAKDLLLANVDFIADEIISWVNYQITNNIAPFIGFTYDANACRRDARYIVFSVAYDLIYGGNSQTVDAGLKYFDGVGETVTSFILGQETQTVAALERAKFVAQQVAQNITSWTKYTLLTQTTGPAGSVDAANEIGDLYDIIIDVVTDGPTVAPTILLPDELVDPALSAKRTLLLNEKAEIQTRVIAFASDYRPNGQKYAVIVSAGEYYENNPIIVPDNVSVLGDGLRTCIMRPLNANKDMLRVRTGCYFNEFTFRDGLVNGVPSYTFDYSVAFDNALDKGTSRIGYGKLPVSKPTITISPFIQNVSLISFLGGNGVLVDGALVNTPNQSPNPIESENPVDLTDGVPEQGKSMVANAFTMISFGGTGWRLINDAYAQIVSCFQIFMLNGTYTQSGGYCSVTNSATNFGLYALRASGYSPNAFSFDRGFVGTTGAFESEQTITAFGFRRPEGPVEEFIIRIYDPETGSDLTDNFKTQLPTFVENSFNAATDVSVTDPAIFTIVDHGFNNGDAVTYVSNGNANIGGLFDGDTYFVKFLTSDTFSLAFDDSLSRDVKVTSLSTGTHKFKKQDYELIVNERIDEHSSFQDLTITGGPYVFAPGDLLEGITTGQPNRAYVYSYVPNENPSTGGILTVAINKVTIGVSEVRNVFLAGSTITKVNSTVVSIGVSDVAARTDLFAAEFTIQPTVTGGQLTNAITLPGKEIRFHRPSITNSSAHTWEYAGSGIDYNALPQNGGQTNAKYEQYSENAGKVYTSGTNELGDFKVGDFITAFNRTGNITFRNKVTVDTLDVLRLALSDIVITGISTDVDLGENEIGGPSNGRLSTQLAMWSYANNRLGPFIDKNVSTNAVPGSVVQLNSNGQINRDLIPAQRSFSSFLGKGYKSRLQLHEDVPAANIQSGDIATETYQKVELTLNNPVTINEGAIVYQASTDAFGVVTGSYSSATSIIVASLFGQFDTAFATGAGNELIFDPLYLALGNDFILVQENDFALIQEEGDTTPGDGDVTVYPTIVGDVVETTDNYFLRTAVSSQILVIPNTGSYTFTNVPISTAIRYNNRSYVITQDPHLLNSNNRVRVESSSDPSFTDNGSVLVLNSTEFSYTNTANPTPNSATTTATATIVSTTGTSTTGSVPSASLTGVITIGDYVFGEDLPLGSKITAVDMSVDPRTFTVTFPASATVASTNTAQLNFITPQTETGTVRSVITAADNQAQGIFEKVRSGVIANVNIFSIQSGSGYTPASGSQVYQRVNLTPVTGTGTSAYADITVENGKISDVDVIYGGEGYANGDILTVNSTDVGGTGTGFEITVSNVERRIYIDLVGGELFVATQGAPDLIEDNNATINSITATDFTTKSFNALPIGSAGDVDYSTSRITITGHEYTNGDPVVYDPSPNPAIGNLLTLVTYYTKVIDPNTIELYQEYGLVNKVTFGSSSTGTHNLVRYAINTFDNSFYISNHGLQIGDAVRVLGSDLFFVSSLQVTNNETFFVGSVTQNSFTIHSLRSDALNSALGLTINALDITDKGTGNVNLVTNDVLVISSTNTSNKTESNWNSLAATTIDASNIISGLISPSRLANGSANSDTFLRGDSQWSTAVKSVQTALGSSLTASGSGASPFYGNITLDVIKADKIGGSGNYSSVGVAGFNLDQFAVGTGDQIDPGLVFIKAGVIDAGTLDTYDSSYFLNPSNLTSAVPVNKGGTGLSSYTAGDMIFATGASTINKLSIGRQDTVITSTGSAPQWSPSLNIASNININSGYLDTDSTTSSRLFDSSVRTVNIGGNATSVAIGNNAASEDLSSRVSTYTAPTSTNVIANLAQIVNSTNLAALNGSTIIDFLSTTGIKVGMAVGGSPSVAANTLVVGLTGTTVYLSNPLIGNLSATVSLTFTETTTSLGIKVGDQITISGSGVTNLNGTWPVVTAGPTSTTFVVRTSSNVTASNVARAGTITKAGTLLLRNRTVTLGSTEASTSPVGGLLKAENSVGTNTAGANLTIRAGLSTGQNPASNLSGSIIFQTGATGTAGSATQQAIERMTIGQGNLNTLDLYSTRSTANLFNSSVSTASMFGESTSLSLAHITSSSVNVNIATGSLNPSTLTFGSSGSTENTFKLASDATGTANITTDVTTGVVNIATSVITGTVNVATSGASTINLGNTSSTVRVGTLNVANQNYTSTSETTNITSAAATVIDTFAANTFRSGKYTLQVTCTAGTDVNTYQVSEVLVIHNGTTSTLTDYGVIKTGANELVTYTTDISGGNVRILAQARSGQTVTVKLVKSLLTV
jgi:hypothetical protein